MDGETAIPSDKYEKIDVAPFILGTTVSVYRIAALVRRVSGGALDVSEARYGYPNLTEQQILDVFDYAENFPKQGKPYPPITLKTLTGRLFCGDDPDV